MNSAGRSEPPEPTLLLGENLSGPKVHALLKAGGIKSVPFRSLLPQGAPDIDVIAAAVKHGLVIVTRDRDFRNHPAISTAFRSSTARCIHVVANGAGIPSILAPMLIQARRKISAFAASSSAPAMAVLRAGGKLTVVRLG